MKINVPEFPTELAFKHGFEVYGQAYNGIDWICPAFNFASALAQVSMAIGKSAVVEVNGRDYLNFYQVILGRSHLAAKSPTLNRTKEGIDHLRRNVDPPEMTKIISSINSVPGFKADFATHENGDAEDPMLWYIKGHGVRGFLPFDELATLLLKSKRGSEDITAELTARYNPTTEPMENNTRSEKTYGEDWIINVFGCSTLTWYEKYIDGGDFSSGFLNRFVFYLHEQQEIKPFFSSADLGALGVWQSMITELMRGSIQYRISKTYKLDEEVEKPYSEWYVDLYSKLVKEEDEITLEASARVVSQTLKLAAIYTILNNKDKIGLAEFQSAKAVGEYWAKCAGATLDAIDFDQLSKNERRVMDAAKRVKEKYGEITLRNLRNAINKKTMSSNAFNRAVEDLVNGTGLNYFVTESGKKIIEIVE